MRELGVSSEVRSSDTAASELAGRRGLIISGGPSSVYEAGSPQIDPGILSQPETAVLGICYGQQLMAHLLGGSVRHGDRGEYGLAHLQIAQADTILKGIGSGEQVWMSHRDLVDAVPPGFEILGSTETCPIASMADPVRRLYAVQFHPEVVHTTRGREILSNFLFDVCGCVKDWSPTNQIEKLEEEIRTVAAGRRVFFFASGGVDSTVAYTLCLQALGAANVQGIYVDTGLMRQGETDFVRQVFADLGAKTFLVEDAGDQFLEALRGATDPEKKRHIIGEQFVAVQERILRSGEFLDGQWILGQGTIYPDTIESGGTAKAEVIKTHHNRVAGIQKLIDTNRIIEPLSGFYKDEVREVGRKLGLPDALLERHPFPGPGLAIRCLCTDSEAFPQRLDEGWLVPVRSVGVQGDARSYRPILAVEAVPQSETFATDTINRLAGINRVIALLGSHTQIQEMRVPAAMLDAPRLERLRIADEIVRRLSIESGFEQKIWQFPVVLIPFGTTDRPDSIVLRPVDSVDGMTASSVKIDPALAKRLCRELLAVQGVCAVFHDLTHKPPGTIEWE